VILRRATCAVGAIAKARTHRGCHDRITKPADLHRASPLGRGLLRESANDAIQRNPRMRLLLNLKGDVTEGRSDASPELQAADVAAGYARRLYESEDGLKNVCVEFRQVLLNGTLVRDCQQQPCVG